MFGAPLCHVFGGETIGSGPCEAYGWNGQGLQDGRPEHGGERLDMSVIVAAVGWALIGMGALSVIRPTVLVRFLSLPTQPLFLLVVIGRLVLGAALIGAASGSRFPTTLLVLGILTIVFSIAGLFFGLGGFRALISWFLSLPSGAVRIWGLFAVALGVFMVIAVR